MSDIAASIDATYATPQPLTADQLAEIQALWALTPADGQPLISLTNSSRPGTLLYALGRAPKDVPALLVEVDRLKQAAALALAQLRQVQALDTYSANRLDLAARILTDEEAAS